MLGLRWSGLGGPGLDELGQQISLLLVEQYVERALEIADYVYVLNNGRIAAQGPAEEFDRARILASYLGEQSAESPE